MSDDYGAVFYNDYGRRQGVWFKKSGLDMHQQNQ